MTRYIPALAFFIFTNLAFAGDDAPAPEGTGAVPSSKIAPAKLLDYTHQRWQAIVTAQYGCANPSVISADSYSLAFDGVIKERWQTKVCNFGRNFWVILSPDGNGGYIVSFGQ